MKLSLALPPSKAKTNGTNSCHPYLEPALLTLLHNFYDHKFVLVLYIFSFTPQDNVSDHSVYQPSKLEENKSIFLYLVRENSSCNDVKSVSFLKIQASVSNYLSFMAQLQIRTLSIFQMELKPLSFLYSACFQYHNVLPIVSYARELSKVNSRTLFQLVSVKMKQINIKNKQNNNNQKGYY